MNFPFIGHAKNWQLLTKEAAENRLPPAYLFYGLLGIGKKLVARTFVQFLFCQTGPVAFSLPCHRCSACTRIESNQHPDYFLIQAGENSIRIDEIRLLQKSLTKAPLEAPLKVVMIDEAEEMTLQAANSLLKTLEEPPPDTLFILIAPHLFRVIPTIRSRCRPLYFSAPPLEESEPLINSQTEGKNSRDLLQAAEGSIGLALELSLEGFEQVSREQDQFFGQKQIPFSNISSLTHDWISKEVNLTLALEILKKKIFQRMKAEARWTELEKIDRITQAQKDIERNVNKALVLENLLLDLAR